MHFDKAKALARKLGQDCKAPDWLVSIFNWATDEADCKRVLVNLRKNCSEKFWQPGERRPAQHHRSIRRK